MLGINLQMLLCAGITHKHVCSYKPGGRNRGVCTHIRSSSNVYLHTQMHIFAPSPCEMQKAEGEVCVCTIATFHFSFCVIHSALVCLKNEMHEFKTHSVLYRVIRVYYALNCNLNNTMQIIFR